MVQIQEVTPDPVDNSGPIFDAEPLHKLVDIILFIVDSRCSKHMTGNIKLLTNFMEKFLGTVKFRNDQIASILGYGDLVQGTITIKRVYYVKGLNHNLFSVGYSTQSKAYRVFNKRTRIIVKTIHVNFDELPLMASDHVTSKPVPQGLTTVLEQESLSPDPKRQENVPQVAETVTTSNELELLYSSMFNELLNGSTLVVSKSSVLHAADATDKRQHQNITHSSTKTVVAVEPPLNIHTTP
ncbi:hypothetical protein Tco_1503709 [Tanacetum coccineum]